jgi:type VI secretion system secreted protein VgrG
VLRAVTNACDICPGYLLDLASVEPRVTGKWLVLEVTHEATAADAGGRDRYAARFAATPKDTPYRPRRSPSPRIGGVENATTTGPGREELHTEEHARVKAQLRWDRRGHNDEKSSTWVRTLQPPTSGGFMLPRVGWEVLLGFVGESADRPIVLGRLSNGADRPLDAQPAHKTSSAFGSLTTPGGRTRNLVRMVDTAGAEEFHVVASRDFNEKTENDKVTAVKGNDSETVGANRTLIVGQVHGLDITGSQTHAVGGDRHLSVDANMSIDAAAESISVGAVRTFKVGGDSAIACKNLARVVAAAKLETAIEHQTRGVTGASTIAVGGSWNAIAGVHASVSVGGASSETVGGPKQVTASQGYISMVKGSLSQTFASRKVEAGSRHDEGFQGTATYDVDGSATIKGANVIFVATSKITLKADGATIEITPSGVKICADFSASVGAVDSGDEEYA